MSDDVKQNADELGLDLLDIDDSDVSTDGAGTTASQEADESSANLDLEDQAAREVSKMNQVKAWGKKILTGEADFGSLPKDQQWFMDDLVTYVSAARGTKTEPKASTSKEEVKTELLKERIKDAGLSIEDRQALVSKAREYLKRGYSEYEAWQEALAFNRVSLDASKSTHATMKVGSGADTEKDLFDPKSGDVNKMSPAELARATASLVRR